MRAKDAFTVAFFALVKGVSWLFLFLAAISFWFGGGALNEFAHMDRLLGELLGIGSAFVFAAVGVLLNAYTEG